ncbi:nuclear transport factor 2 family protein [uncultured Propionivibrio sp.]|uniref:nuclear transport factor 2 family protein n=1 Tax=uncultured Propionivibrio sp. TaxID=426737 RepID=UPI0029C04856|nr:nuclear transport factor 2 family protein [uncultured Propionivibrio sp.]
MSVDRLIDFFEHLTPERVADIPAFYADDACFKDPFNGVRGVEAIQAIFAHMYRQVDSPRFVVTDRVVDPGGAMLVWEFHYRRRRGGPDKSNVIRGASHLRFDADGKVIYHRDYWDAAEELYATLPVIGWLISRLRRALSAPQ